MGRMRSDELVAAALLAELLGGKVQQFDLDANGDRSHDWDLFVGTGKIVVEVTSANDQGYLSLWSKPLGLQEIPDLDGVYTVSIATTAKPKAMRKPKLVQLLRDFGAGVVETVRWDGTEPRRQTAAVELETLGVIRVSYTESTEVSGIYLVAPMGGVIAPEVAADAALVEQAANLEKLRSAVGAQERHLFVWIDASAGTALSSMHDATGPPPGAVELADGVDVLWAAGADRRRRPLVASVLWRASEGHWEDWTPRLDRLPGPTG